MIFQYMESNYMLCCKFSIAQENTAKLSWSSSMKNFKASRTLTGSTIYISDKACKLRNHPLLPVFTQIQPGSAQYQIQSTAQTDDINGTSLLGTDLFAVLNLSHSRAETTENGVNVAVAFPPNAEMGS